jgi:hypothetical protein
VSDTCVKHSFETAAGVCRQCQNPYCSECLVFAFGENKPPYCVTCALNVAGVRHQGAKVNPRIRKKGWFGRKRVVDEEPKVEKGFDDIHIELPDAAQSAPVMVGSTRREVSPEVLAMVQSAEAEYDATGETDFGGIAVAAPPDDSSDSLADWAASLQPERSSSGTGTDAEGEPDTAWPESSGFDAWPDDSLGRL